MVTHAGGEQRHQINEAAVLTEFPRINVQVTVRTKGKQATVDFPDRFPAHLNVKIGSDRGPLTFQQNVVQMTFVMKTKREQGRDTKRSVVLLDRGHGCRPRQHHHHRQHALAGADRIMNLGRGDLFDGATPLDAVGGGFEEFHDQATLFDIAGFHVHDTVLSDHFFKVHFLLRIKPTCFLDRLFEFHSPLILQHLHRVFHFGFINLPHVGAQSQHVGLFPVTGFRIHAGHGAHAVHVGGEVVGVGGLHLLQDLNIARVHPRQRPHIDVSATIAGFSFRHPESISRIRPTTKTLCFVIHRHRKGRVFRKTGKDNHVSHPPIAGGKANDPGRASGKSEVDNCPLRLYHRSSTLVQLAASSHPMFFSIDPTDEVPIYEQIVRQVKLAVAEGTLVGGQMIPSVRGLAGELAINPNTIARAYTQLQNDRVVEPLRGRGLIIRRDAIDRCTKARDRIVASALRRVIDDAIAGGMKPNELRKQFEAELLLKKTSNSRAAPQKREKE